MISDLPFSLGMSESYTSATTGVSLKVNFKQNVIEFCTLIQNIFKYIQKHLCTVCILCHSRI